MEEVSLDLGLARLDAAANRGRAIFLLCGVMDLVLIPQDDVVKIWRGTVHDMIDAAFAASDVPMPDDILEQLSGGKRQLWLAVDTEARIRAAMLTAVYVMRSGKMLKMMECGGSSMSDWLSLRVQIEEYAKAQGCDRVTLEGRPGWRDVLRDYKMTGVTLEKRI